MSQVGIYSAYQLGLHDHSSITQGGILIYDKRIVGANVVIFNNPAKSTTNAGFTKLKETTILEASLGSCTIYFTLEATAGGGSVNGRLYFNGAAVGVDHSATPGPTIFNDVLNQDFAVGDKIQIYGHGSGANTCTISLVEIRYSSGVHTIATRTLVTDLPSTYAVAIQTSNTDP